MFRWIADINENESLVRVLPTNVVYIRNIKLGSLTPFVTEHNSVYVYNEKTGKIEEVFEKKRSVIRHRLKNVSFHNYK